MLKFTKLRVSGFKSFVDATDIPIEIGLTGVVGPNGCGKSNLVEAIRWAMGETSAKQMRGGEMDDVIFGGSGERPARNIAEVTLLLDNSARVAPAQFNNSDELEVSRRIEREKGSVYRVNGKEVRARDVQILFADSATGARSTAMVSQGRIGSVIAAKPTDRRLLLEEAAGITGLHSRRHEAELRLRAAETNLERLEDVLVMMDTQLQALKKQARQASRYRNLNDHIRKAEATLFHLKWAAAEAERQAAEARLAETGAHVVDLTGKSSAAATAQADIAATLPELRQAEAVVAAELQRLIIARETLDREEARIAEAKADCERRLAQVSADIERENALLADAVAAIQRLAAERQAIGEASAGEEQAQADTRQALESVNTAVRALDARHTELTERLATLEAKRDSLARSVDELNERIGRLGGRATDVATQRAALDAEAQGLQDLSEADASVAAARGQLEQARQALAAAESASRDAQDRLKAVVAEEQDARDAFTRLEAEERALASVTEPGQPVIWPPLIDAVTVEPGFEAALAAALGEDLSAPADEPAPVHWRTFGPYAHPPLLPVNTTPLSTYVKGPAALERRLSQTGVVESDADGQRLQAELKQGQRLVSRDGSLWRWDGFSVSAGAATAAAARLTQRNQLREVRAALPDARAKAAAAAETLARARAEADAATEIDRATRTAIRGADDAYARARDQQSEIKEKASLLQSRMSALDETATALERDRRDAEAQRQQAEVDRAALPDANRIREEIVAVRTGLTDRRAVQIECQTTYAAVVRATEERRHRLEEIARDHEFWQNREGNAQAHIAELTERRRALADDIAELALRPAKVAGQRSHLLSAIEDAEGRRKAAADRLAESETRLAAADRALKAAEAELAQAREDRIRAEAAVEQNKQLSESLAERIAEKLHCVPGELAALADIAEGEATLDFEAVEKRVERLYRERETMGPVNLRAEQEANELSEKTESLEAERADLVNAIEKLRHGISELNREGRERLVASFQNVDRHFQELFVRLFGGGRAHLTLTESDDPLEAGLEIMASPPGKRLQILSLLSGGEQALTAIALLFAVFLTNPAPICVLDEVDAPLDDANVDRFCTLVEEMARGGRTRFLIITHHRMTMARMDRLFGVTMAERGVSQLVSVDLRQAEALRATA